MFKASRWRSEKNKIKVVIKLQFQATQVPKLGWESMMVTLVPMDVGKPTVILEKAAVINGACHWVNPIYETVKLNQDPKTGKINDKVYQFLVSTTGSTKSGLLGEITINLADYAEAFKPSSVSLPLKATNTGAILHVTLQRMQGDVEGRNSDGNGDITVKKQRKTLQSQLSIFDNQEGKKAPNGTDDINFPEDGSMINHVKVKFPSTREMPLHADLAGSLRKSSSFDAISALGSESSSGQLTPKENGIINNSIYQDSTSLLLPLSNSDTPQKPMTSSSDSITNADWSVSSAPNESMGGSINSSGETGSSERLQESDDSPDKLRSDIVALKRQLEVSELEMQTLRKQVVKENRRGQDLLKELGSLKEERNTLREECGQLKATREKKTDNEFFPNKLQFDGEDPWSMLDEIKQELNHEKNLSANHRLQLQKTQEANSELILAVRDLEELLEQKNSEMPCINCSMHVKPDINDEAKETDCSNGISHLQYSESTHELFETSSENEEQYALDELVKEQDNVKLSCALEQKIIDLNSMVELYKKDREDMEMQMEQLALDYEILKQEKHDISSKLDQTQLQEQLRMQFECSAHLAIINDLEAHVENLETELQKQAESFEAELATITKAKLDQEQRAIQTEAALRKTRLNNANTAERLQEEFKMLSAQMTSTFYANEKLVMQALEESTELRLQKNHLEELLEKTNEELASVKDQCNVKFLQLLSLIDFKTKEADRLFLELKEKQKELENQKVSEEKRQRASVEEMILLKGEMEKLSREKDHLSEQIEHKEKLIAEMEQMKTLIKENEVLVQERNSERNMLQTELASMREEANKSVEEINDLKHIKDNKETMVRNLNAELANLRVQYSNLQQTLLEHELEKEKLTQHVLKLREELQKKGDIIVSYEKKFKDRNELTANKGNMYGIKPHSSKEIASLCEKIQLLEGEIKLKDSAVEDLSNSLLQKKDYSNQIEQMESMREFNRNSSVLCEDIVLKGNLYDKHGNMPVSEKVRASNLEQLSSANLQGECNAYKNVTDIDTSDVRNNGDYLPQNRMKNKACVCGTNAIYGESIIRNLGTNTEKTDRNEVSCTRDQHKIGEVLSEMALLKKQNKYIEADLKEMQERYSDISLKFAEVEGERQQLVKTIRTLKKALKN